MSVSAASAKASSSSAISRSASGGEVIQTTVASLSPAGTSVNGPPGVWNSVEISSWSRSCRTAKVNAVCG